MACVCVCGWVGVGVGVGVYVYVGGWVGGPSIAILKLSNKVLHSCKLRRQMFIASIPGPMQ